MRKRLLVVEDDPSILRGLELNLQLEGYDILSATDGQQAAALIHNDRFDLVVLDLMLPHLNGFQLIKRLRARDRETPIIILSAKSDEEDIVRGLDLGADDYVTKPFRVAELLARVKAHLRRTGQSPVVRFGNTEIDLERRLVRFNGERVDLTAKEYDLLEFMVQREGRALTRDTILAAVWGQGYFGTDRTVDNFITRLRQKFDQAGSPKHFITVRGVGYRFTNDDS